MKLISAFSLNEVNQFPKAHFGDAEKFAIYIQESEGLHFTKTIINSYTNSDEKNSCKVV